MIVVVVEKSLPMAQFAQYANFPVGNARPVATVVIPFLIPAMGKN